tara:strand:+ start:458 stop:886 length:429 start_codon:yes stop_codon:yes gene_type:complete
MAWITLTEQHIKSRLSVNELETVNDAGQESGSEVSRLPGIITQATGLVRGRVSSCRDNQLGEAGMIPEELLWAAAAICKYMLLNSIPTGSELGLDERKEENRRAHDMLDQAAKCELLISGSDSIKTANQVASVYGGDNLLKF